MGNHRRRPDRIRYGVSSVVKFDPREDYHQRHARRMEVNLENKGVLENWCSVIGWSFEVKNAGHHWLFRRLADETKPRKQRTLVEWWPSSAKLIVNKQWDKGVHVHDYLQVRNFLRKLERKIKNA